MQHSSASPRTEKQAVSAPTAMKRALGAVSGAFKGFIRKATAPAVPNAIDQDRVRKAMEALAPSGRMLPSEGNALAMRVTAAGGEGKDVLKAPEEMYFAAIALSEVRV